MNTSKILLLIITFVLKIIQLNAQSFEGEITYIEINEAQKSYQVEFCLLLKESRSKLFIIKNNTKLPGYYLKVNDESYVINERGGYITKDIGEKLNNKKGLKKTGEKEVVLGYQCTLYKAIRKSSLGKETIILSIADSLHAHVDNSLCIKDIGVILKQVHKTADMKIVIEAVEVNKTALDDKLFVLPDYPIKEKNMNNITKKYFNE